MTTSGYNFKMFFTGPMLYMDLMMVGLMVFSILMLFVQQRIVILLLAVIYGLGLYLLMITQERNEYRKMNGLRLIRSTVKYSKTRPPLEMDIKFKNYYELELNNDLPFEIKETHEFKEAQAMVYDQERKDKLVIAEVDAKHKHPSTESPKSQPSPKEEKKQPEIKEIQEPTKDPVKEKEPKKEKTGNGKK